MQGVFLLYGVSSIKQVLIVAFKRWIAWGGFLGLYFLPMLLEPSPLSIGDSRVRMLLDEALLSPTVREDLLLFLMTNTILCAAALACFTWLARGLARLVGVSPALSLLVTLLFGWMLLVSTNAWFFPRSNYSITLSTLDSALLGKILLGIFVALLVFVYIRVYGARHFSVLAGGLICGGFSLGLLSLSGAVSINATSKRNVIIIGVDSLSGDVFDRSLDLLPNLAQETVHATHYTRAYTPLGRTFPAWVSLLSGRSPSEHGAVFNLRNMDHVQKDGLLPAELRSKGYRAVFAIDERRFSNIDESFGFDQVVGPKPGVLDFVLQAPTDTPLNNLLLQTRLGRILLPYSYINSAAHTNYSSDGFVQSVLNSSTVDRPLFLAVHFESAHFPFKTRHARAKVQRENSFLAQQLEALTAVDHQVGQLMSGLRKKGMLDDALVLVLSDHGEGLGDVESVVMLDGQPVQISGFGHGANILSDRQNRIVLAATTYKNGRPVTSSSSVSEQVSLLDVRGAVEGYVRTGEFTLTPQDACLVVETGIRFHATSDYRTVSEVEIAQQAASYYEVDAQGRLRLREDRLPELLASKDIGLRCRDRITWYDAASQRILSVSLDEKGIPAQQQLPRDEDVARIVAYRNQYVH